MVGGIILEYHTEARLPIVILGKCFKKETNLTVGSPSILLKNILEEGGNQVEMYDPWIDNGKPPLSTPAVYFVGTNHDKFLEYVFPPGDFCLSRRALHLYRLVLRDV